MTITQQLKIKDFPFIIKDKNGKEIYFETSNGFWNKSEWDANGNIIYFEESTGYWFKCEYDANGKEIYYKNSDGVIRDKRQWPFSKAIVEVTLEEIADKLGIKVEQLRIKD
jgi:hypothetical protein